MKANRSVRVGITLIELLVVLGIIGLLFSIILPSVGAAREAGRRISCQNNLKQIGIALANYETAYQVYPSLSGMPNYGTSSGNKIILNSKQYSAFTYLLSYFENNQVYNNINFSAPIYDYYMFTDISGETRSNLTAISYRFNLLLCPSDLKSPSTATNYRFNLGTERWYSLSASQTNGPLLSYQYSTAASILDGLSATAVASESLAGARNTSYFNTRRDILFGGLGLPFSADDSLLECDSLPTKGAAFFDSSGCTWAVGTLSQTCYNHIAPPNSGFRNCLLESADPAPGIVAATSNHPGGVNVLFMDGSVKFISNNISKYVWRSISTGSGGELATSF